ncbi:MAG: hypothetical protein HZC23_13305 [Rhodocyclales bacterium]|nr:hypothetical protein [Rhodocyclales bacterium]
MNKSALIPILLGVLLNTGAAAEELAFEAAKSSRLQEVLRQQPVKLYESVKVKDYPFCDRFLKALKRASPEIKYVEPVLRTDDPGHPKLARYEACYRREGGRGESGFALCAVGERRFRLYSVELDGNRKNGPEEYLYGQEPSCNLNRSGSAQYVRTSFPECEIADFVYAAAEDPLAKGHITGFSALVHYRGDHFIVNLDDFAEAGYTISLNVYDKAEKLFSGQNLCVWKSQGSQNDIKGRGK